MDELGVVHSTALPIREISALTVRSGESGPELLAVGDEDFAVIKAELDGEGRPVGTWRYDLCRALPAEILDSESGSGFEGIAADGEGRIFVLQEEESRVLVLSADAKEMLGTFTLVVPEDTPGYGAKWHENPNERGEGLVLLDSGHVLVAKQKNPACLIEFGPHRDRALGVGPNTVAKPTAAFDYLRDGELVPLAAWLLGEDTAEALPTLNDIAVDDDGRVYVISSAEQVIARLERRLEPDEGANANRMWRIDDLPGGGGAKPEGLALVAGGRPAVGIDSKIAGDNVVLLNAPD